MERIREEKSMTSMSSSVAKSKHIFKVIVLGNISVGKTSLIQRIMGGEFKEVQATVGVEFGEYEVKNIEEGVDLSIQVWDTSGAERYKAVTTCHIRNADGAILVYDVTDHSSFSGLDYWIDAIMKANAENIIIYLLGNKIDIGDVEVEGEELESFQAKHKIQMHSHVSAKTNLNIMQVFKEFYTTIYESQRDFLLKKSENFKRLKEKRITAKSKEKNCCSNSSV